MYKREKVFQASPFNKLNENPEGVYMPPNTRKLMKEHLVKDNIQALHTSFDQAINKTEIQSTNKLHFKTIDKSDNSAYDERNRNKKKVIVLLPNQAAQDLNQSFAETVADTIKGSPVLRSNSSVTALHSDSNDYDLSRATAHQRQIADYNRKRGRRENFSLGSIQANYITTNGFVQDKVKETFVDKLAAANELVSNEQKNRVCNIQLTAGSSPDVKFKNYLTTQSSSYSPIKGHQRDWSFDYLKQSSVYLSHPYNSTNTEIQADSGSPSIYASIDTKSSNIPSHRKSSSMGDAAALEYLRKTNYVLGHDKYKGKHMYVSTNNNNFTNKIRENTGEDEAIHKFMKATYLQISHGDTNTKLSTAKGDYKGLPQVTENPPGYVNSNFKKNIDIRDENLVGVDIPKGTLYNNSFQKVENPFVQESKNLTNIYKERIQSTQYELGMRPEKKISETQATYSPKDNDTSPAKKLVSFYSKRMQAQTFVVGEDPEEPLIKDERANYNIPPKDSLMDMKKTNFQFSYQKHSGYSKSASAKTSTANLNASYSTDRNKEDYWKNKNQGIGTRIKLGGDSSPTKAYYVDTFTWKDPKAII